MAGRAFLRLSEEALGKLFQTGTYHFTIGNGVPEDAQLVSMHFQTAFHKNDLYLVFMSESFKELSPGDIMPEIRPEIVNIIDGPRQREVFL